MHNRSLARPHASPAPPKDPAPDQRTRWSPAEMRVWIVVTSPTWRQRPVAEQIKAAHTSRTNFFRILRRPEFAAAVREHWLAVTLASIGEVIELVIVNARLSGKDGDRSRESLLKMAGLLADRGGLTIAVTQQNTNLGTALAEALARAAQQPDPPALSASTKQRADASGREPPIVIDASPVEPASRAGEQPPGDAFTF